jgi:hypothetical protein
MVKERCSKEEIEKERNPFELYDWLNQKVAQICSTEEGLKDFRLQKGFLKQLIEEVGPLAIFGKRKFSNTDQVLLQPVIGNQNYDAIVTDLRTKPAFKRFLEITQSHEGENDYWRRFELLKKGIVFSHAPIIKVGKGKNCTVSIPPEATSVEGRVKNELNMILDAAKRKAGKEYPANTSLIIFFNDMPPFEEALKVINNTTIDDFVKKEILNLDLRFSQFYLVGGVNELFREYLIKRSC